MGMKREREREREGERECFFFQIKLAAIKINGRLNCVKFLVGSI